MLCCVVLWLVLRFVVCVVGHVACFVLNRVGSGVRLDWEMYCGCVVCAAF